MVEITRIMNAQITMIEKMDDKDAEAVARGKGDFEKSIEAVLKKALDADDVQVETKDFIRENVQPWKKSIIGHFTRVE